MKITRILLGCILILGIVSCEQNNTYEKNIGIANQKWDMNDIKEFKIDIEDTTSIYRVFLNVRHSSFFKSTNLWINLSLLDPDSIPQADMRDIKLGSNEEEKWLGECMGDICDRQVFLREGVLFPKPGTYVILIQHAMRDEVLDGIMDVGIKVEKYLEGE